MIDRFFELIKNNLEKIPKKDVCLAFSGGIDSVVIGKLFPCKCYVAGIEDCHDFKAAEEASAELGLDLIKIKITQEDIKEAIIALGKILNTSDLIRISFNFPIYFVFKNSREKNIILGQGADELLGGYYRYSKMDEKKAIQEMKEDYEKIIKCQQIEKISSYFNKKAYLPFLEENSVSFCFGLDYEFRKDKKILRLLGKKLGLSNNIYSRKKKACQYGSGVMKELLKIKRMNEPARI